MKPHFSLARFAYTAALASVTAAGCSDDNSRPASTNSKVRPDASASTDETTHHEPADAAESNLTADAASSDVHTTENVRRDAAADVDTVNVDAAAPAERADAADAGQRAAPPQPTGTVSLDVLPTMGSVGFILAEGAFTFYAVPDSTSTSVNHVSVDGRRAYGWFAGDDQAEQGFELDLTTGEFSPIVLPNTRFAVFRGGHGPHLVGKLADDQGTPDDPDDDIRKAFVYDTRSRELTTFTREGYDDIGFSSMNANGVITGFNDFGAQGFLFVDGQFFDIDAPSAYRLFPFQINDQGTFVGLWGTSEATWYDNAVNPSVVGEFDSDGIGAIERYEFPGYSGTGLAGINGGGVMAGIAYPTADSRPVVFTTKALDALPKVHRLPEHLEPFVVGIDERGWVYGQAFIHDIPNLETDPEVANIDDNVTAIRSHVTELSGPTHSGPLSGVIHSAFHDVESPVIELEAAVDRLVVDTQDREANHEAIRSLLVDELWIETRKLDAELTAMRTLVLTSSASDTPDAEVVTQVIANAQSEVVILKAHIASMAEQFQEPTLVEYTGVGGPLNPKLLEDGNVLVALLIDDRVVELSADGSIAWSHSVGGPSDAQRLDNGNTLIASTGEERVLELTPLGDIVWEYPGEAIYGVRRLANGNTLITVQSEPASILEVNSEHELVWQYGAGTPSLLAPSTERLDNGHTLIADNSGYHLGGALVSELDANGDIVWTYDRDIFGIYGVARLDNGNTLINDQSNGRLLEVSPSGDRVWSYGALSSPGGFQVLPNSELLIAVFGENRIVRIAR